MIYITGDCHANFERFNKSIFPEQEEMTKDDFVIICGDFGGVWSKGEESNEETMLLDWLEWKGGKVHKIRPSVIHLMRGQIFTIDEKKIFTFGGAKSHDISGGILEPDDIDFEKKRKELNQGFKPYRINHISWWKQELPTEEEMEEGRRNLEAIGNKVDFIVTHCCASSTEVLVGGGMYKSDYLNGYFEELRQKVTFQKWFFGHYHGNKNVNAQEILIYEQIIRIA